MTRVSTRKSGAGEKKGIKIEVNKEMKKGNGLPSFQESQERNFTLQYFMTCNKVLINVFTSDRNSKSSSATQEFQNIEFMRMIYLSLFLEMKLSSSKKEKFNSTT
jgi:hypothetical protein